MVPHDESAVWWQLVRHFVPIGRWDGDSDQLEMCQLGRWKRVRAQRPTVILSFPRSTGARTWPVEWRTGGFAGSPTGYSRAELGGGGLFRPLLEGSFVYQPGLVGHRGVLYRVWRAFDASTEYRQGTLTNVG